MAAIRAHVVISGNVQGVAFRYYARREAFQLGLTGWIRNLPSGNVEAVYEGEDADVEAMVRWCRKGPPGAWVKEVSVERLPATAEFDRFEITR